MKFNIEHTRPFNAEHAQAGAPYCQKNGLSADIRIWDAKNSKGFVLIGSRRDQIDENDIPGSWNILGGLGIGWEMDLVMTPLGYCEGKPVFVGDELHFTTMVGNHFARPLDREFNWHAWPRKEPVMPIWFAYSEQQATGNYMVTKMREKIEAYWAEVDKFNGVKK